MESTGTNAAASSVSRDQIDRIYQQHSRAIFATLVRLLNDLELAEESLHEAFVSAVETWPRDGIPENPPAWLVSTGRFKAIDHLRRRAKLRELEPEVANRIEELRSVNEQVAQRDVADDRLRLIFTCCHPAIDPQVQVPLTLREVCGLTTEEIAAAFLTSPTSMAQRIVRGKAKIRDARIPFHTPNLDELPERLDAVLRVVYLVFNEGYAASAGEITQRVDLAAEAIRLARLLLELLPDPEVMGLLALMLLHQSRSAARTDADGNLVLLEDQDRALWDRAAIEEGLRLVRDSLGSRPFGSYTLQAAIAAVHAEATSPAATDWNQIVALYTLLLRAEPSPVIELNRAVAVAMRDGPAAGVVIIDEIFSRGELLEYHLAHSARGELLRRDGQLSAAAESFRQALSLAKQEPERRFLQQRLQHLGDAK